jgi:hypothetical protein
LGAETDQFYAASAIIRDSSNEINDFFQQNIEKGLYKSNHLKTETPCQEVATEILTQVLGEFSIKEYIKDKTFSKVSYFVQKSPLVDRYPNDNMNSTDYRALSIYKSRPFPSNMVEVARTININGFFVGSDKIGHFSILGKTYYKNFLKELANGLTADQAQSKAIQEGFRQEIAVLGYAVGGTLSYADLEANYQGLQYARNMCEGHVPHLVKLNGVWIQNSKNRFDIRNYVNPKMDEAFNVSFWSPRLWKKIKSDVVSAYCTNKQDPNFKLREEVYDSVVKITINDKLIESFVKEHPRFDRSKQLLMGQNCLNKK